MEQQRREDSVPTTPHIRNDVYGARFTPSPHAVRRVDSSHSNGSRVSHGIGIGQGETNNGKSNFSGNAMGHGGGFSGGRNDRRYSTSNGSSYSNTPGNFTNTPGSNYSNPPGNNYTYSNNGTGNGNGTYSRVTEATIASVSTPPPLTPLDNEVITASLRRNWALSSCPYSGRCLETGACLYQCGSGVDVGPWPARSSSLIPILPPGLVSLAGSGRGVYAERVATPPMNGGREPAWEQNGGGASYHQNPQFETADRGNGAWLTPLPAWIDNGALSMTPALPVASAVAVEQRNGAGQHYGPLVPIQPRRGSLLSGQQQANLLRRKPVPVSAAAQVIRATAVIDDEDDEDDDVDEQGQDMGAVFDTWQLSRGLPAIMNTGDANGSRALDVGRMSAVNTASVVNAVKTANGNGAKTNTATMASSGNTGNGNTSKMGKTAKTGSSDSSVSSQQRPQHSSRVQRHSVSGNTTTGGFLPMMAVSAPEKRRHSLSLSQLLHQQQQELDGDGTRFSTRYHGMHTENNASADHLSAEQNCALWLTNLPADVTYTELLGTIRHVGRVWCSYINLPDGVKHHTAAAKVVFFTPDAAQKLLTQAWTSTIVIREHRVRVSHNRIKSDRNDVAGPASRVLIITGRPDFVRPDKLREWFAQRFIFQEDASQMLIEAPHRGVCEFRFGSYRCQAQMGKMALEKDRPEGFEKVEFGEDPCEVGDLLAAYGVAAERIQGRGL